MIDLSAAQVAEHLQAILDLRSDLRTTTFDFREEAPAYIDSTRMYKALNVQDYIRALQLGGYGFTSIVPRTTITGANNNAYPHSLFNYGQKTLLLFSSFQASIAAPSFVQIQTITADPAFASVALLGNHKMGISNLPAATSTFTSVSQTVPSGTIVELSFLATNSGVEALTNGKVLVIPAKTGIVVWIINTGATTSIASHLAFVELPF